jgi:hemerythrin superfamily protein
MDAVGLLIAQHRALEERMDRLHEAEGDAERAALLAEVGDHLTVHMAAEEEIFYPAVRAARTEDILLESLEEHLSLKRLLADLLELAPGAPTFEPKFKVLKEQAEHHHKEEEEHLFPTVRKLIEAPARAVLGEQMSALQQRLQRRGAPREAVADQTDEAAPLQ